MSEPAAEEILRTFIHIKDGGRADALPVSDTFWQELAGGAYPALEQGRLLSAFTFSEAWPVWECHPAGEELVMLLSGAATLILDEPAGQRAVALSRLGSYLLIPRDVWHTATASRPTTLLFLTPGAGTEHRPV